MPTAFEYFGPIRKQAATAITVPVSQRYSNNNNNDSDDSADIVGQQVENGSVTSGMSNTPSHIARKVPPVPNMPEVTKQASDIRKFAASVITAPVTTLNNTNTDDSDSTPKRKPIKPIEVQNPFTVPYRWSTTPFTEPEG